MLKEEAWKVWRRYSSLHFLPFCGERSFSFPLFSFVYFRFFLFDSIAFRFWSGNDFMKIVHLINWKFSDDFRFFWSLNWVERLPSNECRERIIIIISFFPRAVLWFKYYWILPIIRRVGKSGLSSTWRSYRKRFKIFLFFNSRVYICWYYARDESSVFDRRTLWMVGHVTTYPSISMKC